MDEKNLARQIKQIQEIDQKIRAAIQPALDLKSSPSFQKAISAALEGTAVWAPAIADIAAVIANDPRLRLPSNWESFDSGEFDDLMKLTEETGWALIEAPSDSVIKDLVSATSGDERTGILLSNDSSILETVSSMSDVDAGGLLEDVHETLTQSIGCYRKEDFRAAQALATSGIAEIVHEQFSLQWTKARKKFSKLDIDEAGLHEGRLVYVQIALAVALEEFWPDRGDPIPVKFNRHATAHTVSRVQFTQVNALSAIMLLGGLQREQRLVLDLSTDENMV